MIFSLQSPKALDTAVVGGKASALARLAQNGFPVPDGFVIAAAAFPNQSLREEVWLQIVAALRRLRHGRETPLLAVRSSALSEDNRHTSFAGSFDSVLNVGPEADIRAAVAQVLVSAANARVTAYSNAQGVSDHQHIGVIIQKMIPAAFAGVLFTADPLSGSFNHMIGNYVSGLGDALVSGTVPAQSFTLSRPKGRYEGPPALNRHGRPLFRLARDIEKLMGSPQDIEWAVVGRKPYVLQARPITTMQPYNPATGVWNDSLRGDYLWTNSNFGEAVPTVMTPLTWSILQIYGQETFTIQLPGNHPLFGNIGGRLYMNISLGVSMMKAVGLNEQRIDAQTSEFFGKVPPQVKLPLLHFSRPEILKTFIKGAPQAWRRVRRDRKRLADFAAAAPAEIARYRAQIAAASNAADCLDIWRSLLPYYKRMCQMLQAGTGLFEDKVRPLRQKLIKLVGAEEAHTLLTGFNAEGEPLASLGPLLGLWQLAHGELAEDEYKMRYGHRGVNEFELSWPRPAENPDWIHLAAAQLETIDIVAILQEQAQNRDDLWARFARQQPRQAPKIKDQLAEVAAAARSREAIRSEIIRCIWALRDFALRTAVITGLGDDIWFLDSSEMIALLGGEQKVTAAIAIRKEAYLRQQALPTYPALINGRFDPEQWANDPQRRSDLFDFHQNGSEPTTSTSNIIQGVPGASGIVEGSIRLLEKPEDASQFLPGEILLTVTTNIGWTPLFPRAAAIVTDVGAPLSHAAIVARELGIPAVVGCGQATMRLKTGDKVRVNGRRGTVQILNSSLTESR